jgi:glutamate dehydrogenase
VKARAENNAEVGDRANDAQRINAEDLRAKVIGEGANLGITQAARIAFSLQGGRINTDFVDNSAGVDCSDNEVNIKIALNSEVAEGVLTVEHRNALLAAMTASVAQLVLEDNRLQTLALSIAESEGAEALPSQLRLIGQLEAGGKLDRAVEGVAGNEELQRRAADGKGLTRPELAVVMATAKLSLQAAIESCSLASDAAALPDLFNAFPPKMREDHAAAIKAHRLRGEIIATKLANRIVNRLGLIHPFELAEEEGCSLDDVAEAFLIAEQVYDIPALWAAIDAADMAEATRLMLFDQVAVEMRAHMADILRNSVSDRSNDKAVAAYRPIIESLSAQIDALLPAEARRQTTAYGERLIKAGAPRKLAERLVRLAQADGAIGVAALSVRRSLDPVAITRAFTLLGEALGLDWAQGTAMQLDPSDPWERLLAAGLARDFQAMRLDFLDRQGGAAPEAGARNWIDANTHRIKAFRQLVDGARLSHPTPAMLAQIAGQARSLLAR